MKRWKIFAAVLFVALQSCSETCSEPPYEFRVSRVQLIYNVDGSFMAPYENYTRAGRNGNTEVEHRWYGVFVKDDSDTSALVQLSIPRERTKIFSIEKDSIPRVVTYDYFYKYGGRWEMKSGWQRFKFQRFRLYVPVMK